MEQYGLQLTVELGKLIHDFYIVTDMGGKQKISLSVGIAQANDNARTFLMLYQLADNALYRAKQAGKDRFSR